MLAVIKKDQTVLDVEEKFACCRNGQAYQEKNSLQSTPENFGIQRSDSQVRIPHRRMKILKAKYKKDRSLLSG